MATDSFRLKQSLEEQRSDWKTRKTLTQEELVLNEWILRQKVRETSEFASAHGGYHPAQKDISFLRQHVLDSKTAAGQLWPLIKSMPKAAILHAHFDSIVDCRWLVSEATYRDNCFMTNTGPLKFSFKLDGTEGWSPVSSQRYSYPAGRDSFDAMLHGKLTLSDAPMSDPERWALFLDCFTAIEGLITYVPVFKKYLIRKFQMLLDDGVFYIEERLVYLSSQLYDDVQTYPLSFTFEVYMDVLNEFRSNNARFIGAKIIFCGLKVTDKECCRRAMQHCFDAAESHPELICGFDLVGYEDAGYPLAYYQDEILWFQDECTERNLKIPFVWHAGETVDTAQHAHENVFNALATGTARIGHGLSIAKHAMLMDVIRERNICVELCPISNRILNYTATDMRLHPFLNFLNAGVQITLSPDDPSIFGINNNPASYDYWMVLMSWNSVDLATLKMLAMNSISYSLASDQEKKALSRLFEAEWFSWLERNTPHCLSSK